MELKLLFGGHKGAKRGVSLHLLGAKIPEPTPKATWDGTSVKKRVELFHPLIRVKNRFVHD